MTDIEALMKDYSNVLESSTILAILSDYDLTNPDQVVAARIVLELVKGTVGEDDDTRFDPSAASGPGELLNEHENSKEEEGSHGASQKDWKSQTDDTTPSDFADSGSSQDYPTWEDETPNTTSLTDYEHLDDNGKVRALTPIFPLMTSFDITWTIKKYQGNFNRALDELFSQSFFEESGERPRGIDGFVGDEKAAPRRKGKPKGNRKKARPNAPVETSSEKSTTSRWRQGQQDIDLIASKTGYPKKQITSLFHENGASARTTIAAIIKAHQGLKLEADDPVIQLIASEIKVEFPTIPAEDLEALVQITSPSEASARALAKLLVSRPSSHEPPIQLDFKYAPINLAPKSNSIKPLAYNAVYSTQSLDYSSASDAATSHREARDTAFNQASTASHKARSDHLMGGAAAYYSQIGHDHNAKLRNAETQRADALVAGQSKKSEVDLHGVDLKNALRISSERVAMWWHELQESKKSGRGGVSTSYRIVTGVGNHSIHGRGVLGPAVSRMLMRDGWKFYVETGVVTVIGVENRK